MFLGTCSIQNDDFSSFKSLIIIADEIKLLQEDAGIIDFWLRKRYSFPIMQKIALIININPASQAASQRDFSHLKLLFVPERSLLKDDIIEDILYVQLEIKE